MIQPSGLPGLRQATTRPTTPNGATTQTGTDPPLAFRFWCARPASGTAATTSASSAAPPASTTACAGLSLPMQATVRPDRSGNVTVRPALSQPA